MKACLSILTLLFLSFGLYAQMPDTTGIYKDREDTLSASTAVGSSSGNYISKLKDVRTEVITASGLCKMACCNLAESFENSASVTVGYSDAVTGARQIRLLGLSGVYTQMLDENRPVMRGLASPFGLSYVPGQWLSSIQIAKGASSVINGVEGITGQINMEHRKPTDEIPLFINAAIMSDTKADLNIASSLQLNEKWSTVILGHVSGNFASFDMDKDGFIDEPKSLLVNLSNRWLYFDPSGMQARFGFRYLKDNRRGGQYDPAGGKFLKPAYARGDENCPWWGTAIDNQSINAYLKLGFPLNYDNSRNIALVADFNDYITNGGYGRSSYDASQISGFANLLFQDQSIEDHHYTVGLSACYDRYDEMLQRSVAARMQKFQSGQVISDLFNVGAFGEYTYKYEDKVSVIAGVRADWYRKEGVRVSPRFNLKYSALPELVLRLNAGRGLRNSNCISDNIGVMSTGKAFLENGTPAGGTATDAIFTSHPLEDAWIVGGNISYYLPFGVSDNTCISLDYFHTSFVRQLIADYDHFENSIDFYMSDARAFTNNYQIDFTVEPLRRFTISATFRYTDARATYASRGLVEKPMTSRYKGVLNLQYATNLNKWIFDFTASVNGPCRLYDFMGGGQSPVYPILYLQVTHKMKGWDIYFGGENLTNFKQSNPIINAGNPWASNFDASCIWGPLMGIKAYAGIRVTLWKKE